MRGGLLQELGRVLVLVPAKERERGEALVGLLHKVQGASRGTVGRHRFFFFSLSAVFFFPSSFSLLLASFRELASFLLGSCSFVRALSGREQGKTSRDAEKGKGRGWCNLSLCLGRGSNEKVMPLALQQKITLALALSLFSNQKQSIEQKKKKKKTERSPSPFLFAYKSPSADRIG